MSVEIDLGWAEGIPPGSDGASVPASDALIMCIRSLGHVDMSYIAGLCGMSEGEASKALGSSVFLDPETDSWQLSAQYLSGDIRGKLAAAKDAAKHDPAFKRNVEALEGMLPPWVPAESIMAQLGSPWIPAEMIRLFLYHLIPDARRLGIKVLHDEATGSWSIHGWTHEMRRWPDAMVKWGVKGKPAISILEAALNGRTPTVYKDVLSPRTRSGFDRVVDRDATLAALEKQQAMDAEFKSWIFADTARRCVLERIYNERFVRFHSTGYDGGSLDFPGLSPTISLLKHERDAVMRILLTKACLLAHPVGSGKTYTLIAAAMEVRRLDPSAKVAVVAPNGVVSQWAELWREMYPASDILVVSPRNFAKARRLSVLEDIRDGNHDAVIMASSSFDLLPLSIGFQRAELERERREADKAMRNPNRETYAAEMRKRSVERQLKALMGKKDKEYAGLCADQLGIDCLLVDEAHLYKNIPILSSASIKGMNTAGSAKCRHMLSMVRSVERRGGTVVLATGTPLTNSLADAFVWQTYLQPGSLKIAGISDFDAWVGQFTQRVTDWEVDIDTQAYRLVTRFSRFANLDELAGLFSTMADFRSADGPVAGIPDCEVVDVAVPASPELISFLKDVSERADRVRNGRVKPTDDNLLKITADGRKAAVDMRLLNGACPDPTACKIHAVAENVASIWRETSAERLVQLIFCDLSTPGASDGGFNVYAELKHILVSEGGLPSHEIAFIHDAHTEAQRSKLYAAVNDGKVRVLVGSTAKAGVGVNIQSRLMAVHMLDIPWRPADMVQRVGRAVREGNANHKVTVYRYVTERSFDAYSYQLLETKQRAIEAFMENVCASREMDEVGSALSYAEVKALAVGSPRLKERIEAANQLERAVQKKKHALLQRRALSERMAEINEEILRLMKSLESLEEDARMIGSIKVSYIAPFGMRNIQLGDLIAEEARIHALTQHDTSIALYRGFVVCIPAFTDPTSPSVLLRGRGRYLVEIAGVPPSKIVERLDRAIAELPERVEKVQSRIGELEAERSQGLAIDDSSADEDFEIERLRARLASIDAELEAEHSEKEEEEGSSK